MKETTNIRQCVIDISANSGIPFLFGKVATFHKDKEDATDIVLCIAKNRRVWLGIYKSHVGDYHAESRLDKKYSCRDNQAAIICFHDDKERNFVINLGLHDIDDAEQFIIDTTSEEFFEQLQAEDFFITKIQFMDKTFTTYGITSLLTVEGAK